MTVAIVSFDLMSDMDEGNTMESLYEDDVLEKQNPMSLSRIRQVYENLFFVSILVTIGRLAIEYMVFHLGAVRENRGWGLGRCHYRRWRMTIQ